MVVGLRPVMGEHCTVGGAAGHEDLGQPAVQGPPASHRQTFVGGLPYQVMGERDAAGGDLDQVVEVPPPSRAGSVGLVEHRSQDGQVDLTPCDGRGPDQSPAIGVEAVDPARQHAFDRLRKVVLSGPPGLDEGDQEERASAAALDHGLQALIGQVGRAAGLQRHSPGRGGIERADRDRCAIPDPGVGLAPRRDHPPRSGGRCPTQRVDEFDRGLISQMAVVQPEGHRLRPQVGIEQLDHGVMGTIGAELGVDGARGLGLGHRHPEDRAEQRQSLAEPGRSELPHR